MSSELDGKEVTFTKVVKAWKVPLIVFFGCMLFIAGTVSVFNPKIPSFAKEYNYLYSMKAEIEKGREINYDLLEEKLENFASLKPEFDALFTNKYFADKDFEKVDSILEGVNMRLDLKGDITAAFTKATIAIEKEEFEEAYKVSLEIASSQEWKKSYPLVYAYNLYRMTVLEELLGFVVSSKELFVQFLADDAGKSIVENNVGKKLKEALEISE